MQLWKTYMPIFVLIRCPVRYTVVVTCRGGRSQKQYHVQSTTDVPEYALQSYQMRLPRIMHIEADLLNGIGNIWSGQSQIMESTSKAPEGCSILNRNTI